MACLGFRVGRDDPAQQPTGGTGEEVAVDRRQHLRLIGRRTAGIGADHIELGRVRSSEFGGRQRGLPSGHPPPKRHRPMRIQRGAGQLHRGSSRVDQRRAGRDAVQPLRRPGNVHAHSDSVGDHDGEPASQQRRDKALLDVEHQIEPGVQRGVNALAEQTRRRALLAHPIRRRRIRDQRPRPVTRPRNIRFDVGARHRDRIPLGIGAAVHDPGSGADESAQLTRWFQDQARGFRTDHVTILAGRKRVRRGIERQIRAFVAAGNRNLWEDGNDRTSDRQHRYHGSQTQCVPALYNPYRHHGARRDMNHFRAQPFFNRSLTCGRHRSAAVGVTVGEIP